MDAITAAVDLPRWLVVFMVIGLLVISIFALVQTIRLSEASDLFSKKKERNEILHNLINGYESAFTFIGQIRTEAKQIGMNQESMRQINAVVGCLPEMYRFRESTAVQELARTWVIAVSLDAIASSQSTKLAAYNAEIRFRDAIGRETFQDLMKDLDLQPLEPPSEDEDLERADEDTFGEVIVAGRAELV